MGHAQFEIDLLYRDGAYDGTGYVKEKNDLGMITEYWCATGGIPTSVVGYAIGCKVIDTTTGYLYTNTGTATSCSFTAVGTGYSTGQTITTSGAQTVIAGRMSILLNNASAAINAAIANASLHHGLFSIKAGLEPAGGQDHLCTITTGTWDGTHKIATFADINDALVVYFDHAGGGTIISNTGSVALS